MHFKIRGKTHKSSDLVFGYFMPPERLPNHEQLLQIQQKSNKMIRKSRKRNQTKDRKIKNKLGGGTPGTPHNENLKPTIANQGKEKRGAQ